MATNRQQKQHSITIYPEIAKLIAEAEQVMEKPKSRILADACVRGLREGLKEHWNNSVALELELETNDLKFLRKLAEKAGSTTTEFILELLYGYGEDFVEGKLGNTVFTLTVREDNEPKQLELDLQGQEEVR